MLRSHLADDRPLPKSDDGVHEDEVGLEVQGSKVRGRGRAVGKKPLHQEVVTVLRGKGSMMSREIGRDTPLRG